MTEPLQIQERASESVRAVDRALDILLAFRGADDGLSVADLLKRVDLSRPTLYRLLHTLEAKGFVTSSGEPQRFRLGPSVAQLAHLWNSGLNLADIAEPAMKRVWEETKETVALFVPEGLMRLCVKEIPSPHPLSFRRGAGYRERLVLGASGRSILAQIEEQIDATRDADVLRHAGRPIGLDGEDQHRHDDHRDDRFAQDIETRQQKEVEDEADEDGDEEVLERHLRNLPITRSNKMLIAFSDDCPFVIEYLV